MRTITPQEAAAYRRLARAAKALRMAQAQAERSRGDQRRTDEQKQRRRKESQLNA